MPTAEIDIEQIVREVVRRLRAIEAPSPGERSISRTKAPTGGELRLDGKLVTLETLHNRLENVRAVIVPPRAIVTPAVCDELKDRGIRLCRTGNSDAARAEGKATSPGGPTVWVTVDGVDVGALQQTLGGRIAVKRTREVAAAIDVIDATRTGVILTNAPSAAVVTANRNPNVRAAVGFDFPAVRRAIDEADANLLAIDPRGKSTTQLFGMIHEFLNRN